MLAAHRVSQLPTDHGAEVAFAGRSNAGKSSALNALTGQRGLARTSKTPGRTQQMVCFTLPPLPDGTETRLIDLPGYGYAKVPESLREHWKIEIDRYLHARQSLCGVVLIADIRHPLKVFDQMMLDFCADTKVPCHLLLTKADKLSRQRATQAVEATRSILGEGASVQMFSSQSAIGIEEACATLLAMLSRSHGRACD